MDYESASIEELIEALEQQERHPDLDLIRALLERGDEVVPDLVDLVASASSWPRIHAALLLCELQAESALPALRKAASAPEGHDLMDWLADDALEKFGEIALDTLEAIAADKTVEWFQRAVSCRVMATIACQHPKTYQRVSAFLRGLLPDPDLDWRAYEGYEALKAAVDDPQIWTSAACRLCDLRDPQAYDWINQLFQAGLIDELFMDQDYFKKAYESSGPSASLLGKPVDLLSRYERNRPRRQPTAASPVKRARKTIKLRKRKR